jgi:hypothetical protein
VPDGKTEHNVIVAQRVHRAGVYSLPLNGYCKEALILLENTITVEREECHDYL